MSKPELDNSAAEAIKKTFHEKEWWRLVQDEVKEKINEEIDNIVTSGIAFKDAFISGFTYEHNRRVREGIAVDVHEPGVFGPSLSNECYHSSIAPTKSLLHLNEWTLPNDADVQACIYLCQQVELFESLGLGPQTKNKFKFTEG